MPDHKTFTFPLNVYAHLLCLDHGGFDHLHYGLFAPGVSGIVEAQQHASNLLFSKLPAPPGRILDVGIGAGTTLARLAQAGYQATGITPDAGQIAYAKGRHGADLPAVAGRLEEFTDPRPFDLILFQESAQYIDTAALFRHAWALLAAGGQVLIMDEVALQPAPPGEPSLPPMNAYLSQARAAGFALLERQDLGALAAPTNDYLVDALERRRARLPAELDLPAADLDALLESARRYARNYRDGRYGYCLLRFQKSAARPWRAGWAEPADEAELLDLFRRAFGQDMSPAVWRWKYRAARPCGALARRGGHIVAFYGGLPRPVSLFGAPAVAVQIGDVMVDPRERGVLTRRGPFFLAAEQYLRQHVGRGKTYPLAFGFPSARACRLGEKLGLYAKAGEILRVDWPALPARPTPWLSTRPLAAGDRAAVDRLWLEMAAALRRDIVGVRDAAYLRGRYLEHPARRYWVLLARKRLGGAPFGVIVARTLDGELELVDLVAPPERVPTLVAIVRRLACTLGKPTAFTWTAAQHAALFAGRDGAVSPTHIVVPTLAWPSAIPPAEIDGRWWLMPGDTDFR